jgi:hypothetical protein
MTTYYVTADLDRAPTAQEAKEIGVPRAKIFLGRVKAIICADSIKDACARGRKCIEGCIQEGRTISNVGCMPVADAKKLGDDEIYKGYPTTTWLLYYRLKSGMTQAELSKKSGIYIRQIQKVESGEIETGNMAAKTLFALADALGVDISELL